MYPIATRNSHVSCRTRCELPKGLRVFKELLQAECRSLSLVSGGNAHTLMIACVSPLEFNLGETLNTLKVRNSQRLTRSCRRRCQHG